MRFEKDEEIIKKKYDFDNSSKLAGFIINNKLNSGVRIILTNKRFYIEPALGRLNKIIPLLSNVILDVNMSDINNYSIEYVSNFIFFKIPRITVRYKDDQQFSFCVTKKELKDWEEKFSKLSINLLRSA